MAGPLVELMFTEHAGKGIAAKVDIDHGRMTVDDYPRLYAEFTRACGCKALAFIHMNSLYHDQVKDDVWWSTDLCPDGARFTLMVEPHVSREDYLGVRRFLQQRFDVKSFKTLRIDRWVQFTHTYAH